MEVIVSPVMSAYQILAFAIGATAITYIALILMLDRTKIPEPVDFEAIEQKR